MTTGLDIIRLTNHWVRIDGAWYREAWIRDSGRPRFVAIRLDVLGEEL